MKKDDIVTLDVRDDIRQGREPFSKIMRTVEGLQKHQKLLLIAPFEPAPLFGVLAREGFTHVSQPTKSGDYEVLFSRKVEDAETEVIEVDARGLEPPQPLVTILEAAARLPEGAELRALTDRRPMHLFAQLKERGFRSETTESEDGSFVTHIRRA